MEQEQPQRLSARDARNSYGTRALIFLALTLWFGYDGWFNPNIKAKTFNKVGALVLAAYCIFCLIMATSAALALRRESNQPPPSPPAPPSA